MKKRTAFIGAILSLFPLGQPLIIKTGLVLSTTGLMFSVSEKVYAGNNSYYYYFDSALKKGEKGDHYRAISALNKAIKLNPSDPDVYINRGIAKSNIGDAKGSCDDYKKAISLGDKGIEKWLKTKSAASWCRDM